MKKKVLKKYFKKIKEERIFSIINCIWIIRCTEKKIIIIIINATHIFSFKNDWEAWKLT